MAIKNQCVNCESYTSTDFCAITGVNLIYDGSHCPKCVKRSVNVNVNTRSSSTVVAGSNSSASASSGKQRHGCITAWFVVALIINLLGAIMYLFAKEIVTKGLPKFSNTMVVLFGIICAANVIFIVMLFQWKKIGFWGLAGTNIAAVMIYMCADSGVVYSLSGLAGIAVLYGILQIKKNNVRMWDHLE